MTGPLAGLHVVELASEMNIEQTSGMSAVTGYADGPPCNPQRPRSRSLRA